jgi:hypothetical protein
MKTNYYVLYDIMKKNLHCLKFQFMYFFTLLKMRPNEIHLGNEIHFVIKINSIDHQEVYKTKMRPNMTWVSTYIFLFLFGYNVHLYNKMLICVIKTHIKKTNIKAFS